MATHKGPPALLVEVGNTSLKWALRTSKGLTEQRAVRHGGALPLDLLAAWGQLDTPGRILVASVAAPAVTDALAASSRARWDLEPEDVRIQPGRCGVSLAYAEPERLGVDRWLALIAAHRHFSQPVLIVDAGTAITYDLLLEDGRHLGGLILPGIEMMRDALLTGTQIPRVEPQKTARPWASDTAAAVGAGTVEAPAALAERLFRYLSETTGTSPILLLTGGDAQRLLEVLEIPARVAHDLVLQGLALLFDHGI